MLEREKKQREVRWFDLLNKFEKSSDYKKPKRMVIIPDLIPILYIIFFVDICSDGV